MKFNFSIVNRIRVKAMARVRVRVRDFISPFFGFLCASDAMQMAHYKLTINIIIIIIIIIPLQPKPVRQSDAKHFNFNLESHAYPCHAGWPNGLRPACGRNGNSCNVSCSQPSLHRQKPI